MVVNLSLCLKLSPLNSTSTSFPPPSLVMVGYTSLAYENYGFTEGDRRFKISCRLFSGIESRDCVWSAPLGGGHSLQDDPNQGMVFAGLRSDRSGDRRSWRYRVCKISCDSDLSFEPTSATACRGRRNVADASALISSRLSLTISRAVSPGFVFSARQSACRALIAPRKTTSLAAVRGHGLQRARP